MDKSRIEAFSDGVFAIVITLLIFNIKVPTLVQPVSDTALWYELGLLTPTFVIYMVTFAVISVLWINHHFIFHSYAKVVDRQLNLLNLLYLMFVAFLPFSANFIGLYIMHQPAAILYGVNIFLIVLLTAYMTYYIRSRPKLLNEKLSSRTIRQGQIRSQISLIFYALGIIATFIYVPLSILLYAFPIIFNIIPGSLDFSERMFGFTID